MCNFPGHSYIYSFIHSNLCPEFVRTLSIDEIWRYSTKCSLVRDRSQKRKCGGNPAWGSWERLHCFELKEESQFTNQKSGWKFLAEGAVFAKAITPKGPGLIRG